MAVVLDVLKPYLAGLPLPALSGTTVFALGVVIVTAIIFSSLSAATSTITIHKKLIGHHLGHAVDDHLDVSDFEPDDLDDEGRPRPPASARSPSVVRITSLDPSSPLCAAPIRIIDDGSGMAGNKVFLPPPAQDAAPDPAYLSPSQAAGIASSTSSIAGSDTSSILGSDAGSSASRRRQSLSNRRHSVSSVKRNSLAAAARLGKKRSDSLGRRASKRFNVASLPQEQNGASREDGASASDQDDVDPEATAEQHLRPGSSTPLSASLSPSSSEGTWHDADDDTDQQLLSTVSHHDDDGPTTPPMPQGSQPPPPAEALPLSASTSSSLSSAPTTPSPRQVPSSPSTRARKAAAAVQAWHETPPQAASERKKRLPPNVPLPATPLIRLTGAGVSSSSGRGRQREHSSSDADSVRLSGSHHGHPHLHKRTTPPSILRRQPQSFKSAFLPLPSKGRALKAARFLVFPPELEREWQAQVQRSQIQHALLARQELQKAQQLLSGPSTPATVESHAGALPHPSQLSAASNDPKPSESADSSIASTSSTSSTANRPPTPPEKDLSEVQLGVSGLPGAKHVRPPPPPPLPPSNLPLAPSASINGANPTGSPWTPASPWVDTPSGSGTATPMYGGGAAATAATSLIGGFMHPRGLLIGNGGRRRTIRMREPDWTPYAEMHPRAKEREEMRSRTLLARRASVSSVKSAPAVSNVGGTGGGNKGLEPPGSVGGGSRRKKGRRRSNSLLLGSAVIGSDRNSLSGADDAAGWEEEKDSDAKDEADGSKGSLPKVRVDDVGSTSFETVHDSDEEEEEEEGGEEEEFWFERFTRSTAAAGRDWDWRKRRARVLIPAPPPDLKLNLDPSPERSRPTTVSADDTLKADARPGNVGKDAVDIVHEERRAAAASLTVPGANVNTAPNGLPTMGPNNRPSSPRLASPRASPRKASLPLSPDGAMPVPVFGGTSRANENSGSDAPQSDAKISNSPSDSGVQPFPQSSPEATRSGRSASEVQGSPSSSPKSGRRLALSSLTQSSGRGPPSPPSAGKSKGLRAKMALRLNAWTGGIDATDTEAPQPRERRTSADSDLGQKRGLDVHLSSSEVFKIARRRTSSEGQMLELIAADEQRLEDDEDDDDGSKTSEGGGGASWRKGSDASVPVRLSSLTSGRAGSKTRHSGGSSGKSERRKRHTSFGSILRNDDRVQQLLSEAELLSSDDDSTSAKVGGGKRDVPVTPSIILNGHHKVQSSGGGGGGKKSPNASPKSVAPQLPKLDAIMAPIEAEEILRTTAAARSQPPAIDVFLPPSGLPMASPRTTSIPNSLRPRASDGTSSTPTTVRASRIPQTRRTSDTSNASSITTSTSGTEGHGGMLPSRPPHSEQRSEPVTPVPISSRKRILNDAMGAQIMSTLIPSISGASGVAKSGEPLSPPRSSPVSPPGRLGITGIPTFGGTRPSSPSLMHTPSQSAASPAPPPSAWGDTASRLPRRASNSSFGSTSSSNGKTSPGHPSLIPVPVSMSSTSLSSSSSSSSLSLIPSPPSPSGLLSSGSERGRYAGSSGSGSGADARSQLPQHSGTASPTERVRRRTSANLAQADLIRHFSRADPQSMLPYPSSRV